MRFGAAGVNARPTERSKRGGQPEEARRREVLREGHSPPLRTGANGAAVRETASPAAPPPL